MTSEKLWGVDEVAEYLGISVRALYMLRHRGGAPPGFKVGRKVKWIPAEVQRWASEQLAAAQG
jgi:excisionase family DNA binding protein